MTANDPAPKDARLNMRLTAEALETIKQAAGIQQQDLTSFVLGAALDRARSVLAAERILRLSPHDVTQLEAMLNSEPQAIPQLAVMLNRYGNPAEAPNAGRTSA